MGKGEAMTLKSGVADSMNNFKNSCLTNIQVRGYKCMDTAGR
jgi:hypothetical protein